MAELLVPAPLWRRLAAALYDTLVLAGLAMLAAALELALRTLIGVPYRVGVLRGVLFLVGLGYFGWFWTHGGQTPGARAWRLTVRRADGGPLRWPTAIARYAFAYVAWLPLALGVLWCLLDSRRRAWHDLWSGTEVVLSRRS